MAYTVRMTEPVRTYLQALTGLSREGRLKLLAGIVGLVRDHADVLRSDPSRRLAAGAPYFRFDYLFMDAARLWRADCVAADSAAVYGVIEIEYLDCQSGA